MGKKSSNLDLGGGVTLELVHVPEGEFLLGSNKSLDRQADKDEQPQHTVYLDEYWIGKYPVTNAQYRRFLSDTGYAPPEYWMNADEIEDFDDCPVANVDWDDARAFCYWLYWRTKSYVCVPTEPEWEKAARGTTTNIYPWGNSLPPANFQAIGFEKYQVVGKYSPETDSPYGCVDMVTNVGEICNTLRHRGIMSFYKYPYNITDGRENCKARSQRSLKGGALTGSNVSLSQTRCSSRNWTSPGYKFASVGFRIIITKSNERWQIAFPDEYEKTKLEVALNLNLIDLKSEAEDIVGYDSLGLKWNSSGVYIRSDDLKKFGKFISKLKESHPTLKDEHLDAGNDLLPGSSLLKLTKLSRKDKSVAEWLYTQLVMDNWIQYTPEVKRTLTLAQQFDMAPIYKSEDEWVWLRKAIKGTKKQKSKATQKTSKKVSDGKTTSKTKKKSK